MRIHIDMGEDLIERIDALAGKGRRSKFVRDAVVAALEQRDRTELVLSARGAIAARGHEWDTDPAAWVRAQRRGDTRRVG
jgi:metal-responsive CopG/Arc/MetJ family transcriptional regulator